jgi:hypothetical protein
VINSPYWSEFIVAGTNVALHPGGSGTETRTGLGFEVQNLMSPLSEPPRSAAGSPQHARDPRSASELPNLPTPKAT